MRLIRYPERTPATRPTAVAIGNFDGLHQGHQAVLAAMHAAAKAQGLVRAVLTFEPHPRRHFAPHAAAFRLEPLAAKLRRLRDAGVEEVYAPRFDAGFAALSAVQFLDAVLRHQLKAKVVVTGENFGFGKGREGNVEKLRSWGAQHNIDIITVGAVLAEGEVCSSSAVRHALDTGNMAHALALLGRDYTISGQVVRGQAKGRTLGFATANVHLPPQIKLPHYGVYAVRVAYKERTLDGVANLGIKPTLGSKHPTLEVHLFDFSGELYGSKLEVRFVEKLRDEKKFESLAALTHQIADDCLAAKKILGA